MNIVDLSVEDSVKHAWLPQVEPFVQACLAALGRDEWEVSILVCSDTLMAEYNQQYRDKEGPTDVLSFPQADGPEDVPDTGPFVAGDIALCPSVVAANAQEFKVSFTEELARVLVHGLLHLSGMDHATNDADEPMLVEQERLLKELIAAGKGFR